MRKFLACSLILIALAGCSHGPENKDPRNGNVYIDGNTNNVKFCDGTTLVYKIRDGGSVVVNSPECSAE